MTESCLFCFYRGISMDGVVDIVPKERILAVLIMILLFALKSLSIVVYCVILFAASGIIFPKPLAIAVNLIGAATMLTVPYLFGKLTGAETIQRITKKHPKIERLREMRKKNDFTFSLISRAVGVLPADIVSMYMGAIGVGYFQYLLGGLLGFSTQIITFTIMGRNILNPGSPEFIISAIIQLFVTLISVFGYTAYTRFQAKKEKKDR